MDINHLIPGFDNPELGSQQTFRAIVKALDNPGQLVKIKSRLSVPDVLNLASGAIFLTLCNAATSIWADLNWNFQLIEWFQNQCGCSIVTEPSMASLALITKPITMPPLEHFRIGNKEQPDSATTLIIQLFELSVKTAICPIAPVVDKMSTQAPMETMTKSCDHQAEQSNPLSLGVDIFLTCNDILTAWPHSVGK